MRIVINQINEKLKPCILFFFIPDKMELFNALLLKQIFVTVNLIIQTLKGNYLLIECSILIVKIFDELIYLK